MSKDVKFVYSKRLADFLIREKGLRFITYAKHPKTDRLFWLFERGDKLDAALAEYDAQNAQ
jgi:hypothetical protein